MQMRKMVTASLAIVLSLVSISSTTLAAETVKSDMKVIHAQKVSQLTNFSYLVDNSLYAPYQLVAKEIGVNAKWDNKAKSLELSKGSNTLKLIKNGTLPLQFFSGEAYVPVRFVYQTFGYKIVYDATTRTVTLNPRGDQASDPSNSRGEKVSLVADLDHTKATGMRTEGLIGDKQGRLYTADQDSKRLLRVTPNTGKVEELGVLPRPTTGMVFDYEGNLYLASGGGQEVEGVVLRIPAKALEAGVFDPGLVETFVTGVNGANGLTFDGKGNLYVSGAATGNIYVVTPTGKLSVWASGIKPEREEQPITVNGIVFDEENRLYIANTSSGAIYRVQVNKDGSFGQLELFAKNSLLFGADGIVFGPDGDLYVAANERNSIIKVTVNGKVTEVAGNDNQGLLEFPASVHFIDDMLYVSNFDQPRGINKDNKPGLGASIVKIKFDKK